MPPVAGQDHVRPPLVLRALRVEQEGERPQARPAARARPVDEDHAVLRGDHVREDEVGVGQRLWQAVPLVERADFRAQRLVRGLLIVRDDVRGVREHPRCGRDLGGRPAVGQVVPAAAGPRQRARARRERVQPPEQGAEPPKTARGTDRLAPVPARNRLRPRGHQHRPAVERRDRLGDRTALGGEVIRRQVPEDLGVTRHRLGRTAGGKPAGHPVGSVGAPDPPHADVEIGHGLDLDRVRRLKVRPQALGRLARHRRAEPDQVAVRVNVPALAQLVVRIADAAGHPADAGPGPFVVECVSVRHVEVRAADVLVVGRVLTVMVMPRVE
jgi:hypothetical protein